MRLQLIAASLSAGCHQMRIPALVSYPMGPVGETDGWPLRCYPTLVEPWSCWASSSHSPPTLHLLKSHMRSVCSEGIHQWVQWGSAERMGRVACSRLEAPPGLQRDRAYSGLCLQVVASLGVMFSNGPQDLTSQPFRESLSACPHLPGAPGTLWNTSRPTSSHESQVPGQSFSQIFVQPSGSC